MNFYILLYHRRPCSSCQLSLLYGVVGKQGTAFWEYCCGAPFSNTALCVMQNANLERGSHLLAAKGAPRTQQMTGKVLPCGFLRQGHNGHAWSRIYLGLPLSCSQALGLLLPADLQVPVRPILDSFCRWLLPRSRRHAQGHAGRKWQCWDQPRTVWMQSV